MILNVSGRTDIVAFYTKWFMNRLKEGFVDVRNPFYQTQISRINFVDVDAIVFCTKNPIPILPRLDEIKKPFMFQVTLTGYKNDIEPNVPSKIKIIDAIKEISTKIGKEKVYLRYDPILINDNYTVDYHIRAFDKLCNSLDGYVRRIIISFVDDYKNVRNNSDVLKLKDIGQNDLKRIGENFFRSAKAHGMTVQTCAENERLCEYGFIERDCVDKELAYDLTGKTNFKKWNGRPGKNCNCVEMADIGVYNSCKHFCKYCYANYDEKKVKENFEGHDPDSSLLVGKIMPNDIIKVRK